MKRLLFPAFVILLIAAACDPDLTPRAVPGPDGGGGGDGSSGPAPTSDAASPDDDGGPTDDAGDAGTDGTAPKTHVIDGVNDFAPGEKLPTTSPLYDGYVSWDDSNIYFGMDGTDVGSGNASKWVLIYVDGMGDNGGTTAGIGYDCSGTCTKQAANLPFSAGFHLRWKADGSYTDLQKWNGSAWMEGGAITSVAHSGNFMEMSISRTTLGKPSKLKVDMFMLIEQAGAEWTYSGVPSTAFTDGKAPAAITKYFEFDLSDPRAPNLYSPLP